MTIDNLHRRDFAIGYQHTARKDHRDMAGAMKQADADDAIYSQSCSRVSSYKAHRALTAELYGSPPYSMTTVELRRLDERLDYAGDPSTAA